MDDCADMTPMKDALKQKQTKLKRQLSMNWSQRLNTKMRFLAWQSLLKSKVMYGVFCLTKHQPRKLKPLIRQFLYTSLKNVLGMKGRPKAETLFTVALTKDQSIDDFIDLNV